MHLLITLCNHHPVLYIILYTTPCTNKPLNIVTHFDYSTKLFIITEQNPQDHGTPPDRQMFDAVFFLSIKFSTFKDGTWLGLAGANPRARQLQPNPVLRCPFNPGKWLAYATSHMVEAT